ncbi:MAG: hypothetical protein Q8K92_08465 [Leadbetterella sp.]|nr:hypothetical protein [Leadbetterella sp.]
MSKGNKNIEHNAIGRTTDSLSSSPHSFDVNTKRGEFEALYGQLSEKRGLAKRLADYDGFYKTSDGVYELTNVKAGRASFGPTARAVIAMELLVAAEMSVAKKVSRKKLIASAIVVTAVVLGALGLPSVAMGQNGNDGCMIGVVEKESWFLDFMVNACIVMVIATVAAMWVYDYKNRIQKGNN